jgi:hypothetical protein
MVVKIKDSHVLVLASDGTYHKVSRAHHKSTRVGSEIEFSTTNWHRFLKPVVLAASILVFALSLSMFREAFIQPAFAYVSLDINPSVELEVDPNLKVISARPLDKEAEKLLSEIKITGQPLYASVNTILDEAVDEGFLKTDQKNYVLSTVTLKKASPKDADYEALAGELSSAAENKGVEVELLVLAADSQLHKEAKTKGVSAGKLFVYRQAVTSGQSVTLDQVKENSITNLVNDYKIKLTPNDTNLIIKPNKNAHKSNPRREKRNENENREELHDKTRKNGPPDDRGNNGSSSGNKGNSARWNDNKDNHVDNDKDRSENSNKDRDMAKDKDNANDKGQGQSQGQDKDKNKDRDKDNDKNEDKDKNRDHDKGKNENKGKVKDSDKKNTSEREDDSYKTA